MSLVWDCLFLHLLCVGVRQIELKIDAAYEGVVYNTTADPKIRKPL